MFTLPVEKIIKGGIKMKVKKVEDKNVKVADWKKVQLILRLKCFQLKKR